MHSNFGRDLFPSVLDDLAHMKQLNSRYQHSINHDYRETESPKRYHKMDANNLKAKVHHRFPPFYRFWSGQTLQNQKEKAVEVESFRFKSAC